MKRWYLVHTQTYQEARAEVNLRWQGVEIWLPLIRCVRRHARRLDRLLKPLFSSLSFRSIGSHQGWDVRSRAFVVQQRYAACVPIGLIEEIMEMCDQSGALIGPPRPLLVGESVRVAMGRFDLEGLFETPSGQDRVVLHTNSWSARCGQVSHSEDWRHKTGTSA
jgi:transcriptional antiterminator RfaH